MNTSLDNNQINDPISDISDSKVLENLTNEKNEKEKAEIITIIENPVQPLQIENNAENSEINNGQSQEKEKADENGKNTNTNNGNDDTIINESLNDMVKGGEIEQNREKNDGALELTNNLENEKQIINEENKENINTENKNENEMGQNNQQLKEEIPKIIDSPEIIKKESNNLENKEEQERKDENNIEGKGAILQKIEEKISNENKGVNEEQKNNLIENQIHINNNIFEDNGVEGDKPQVNNLQNDINSEEKLNNNNDSKKNNDIIENGNPGNESEKKENEINKDSLGVVKEETNSKNNIMRGTPTENGNNKNKNFIIEEINTINTNSGNKEDEESDGSEEEDKELDDSPHYPKGIKNLGLNCYMNSLLQCLFNIEELREYFLNELKEGKINKKQQPISYRFAKTMKSLLYSKKKFIIPKKFKEVIGKQNSLFKEDNAADATDLFRILIDSFISELKTDNKEEDEKGEYSNNKNEVLKYIQKEMNENIIYKNFSVFTLITYICQSKSHWGAITYSYNNDSSITFNLENIINNNKSSIITLKDCFKYIQKEIKNNSFSCHKCNKISKGTSYERILVAPQILIIILNRGKGKKIENKVNIDKTLDLSGFIDEESSENKIYYQLIGSCNHLGDSSPSGHYTSTCLYNNAFYYFSDEKYQKLKYYDYAGEPYLLFYRRKEIKENDESKKMQTAIEIYNEKKLSQTEVDYCKNVLIKVFNMFQYDKTNFTIKYKNSDIFIWKIIKGKKKPLIMDFSNPPKDKIFNLMLITTIEDTTSNIDEYIDKDSSFINITINLNDAPYDIYTRIDLFLKNIFKNYNIGGAKCPGCNFM